MKDKKVVLQALLCFALVISLILPGVVAGASPAAEQVTDEHPGPDSEVHDRRPTSATGIEIMDWHDLDAIRGNLRASYVLMNDLDSDTAGYAELVSPGADGTHWWKPIGRCHFDPNTGEWEAVDPFVGSFDGQGHEIRDLIIRRPDEDGVGLFGAVGEGGVISNVRVGASTYSYGGYSVDGGGAVGGLIGGNWGSVTDAYSVVGVRGAQRVGGLVGANWGFIIGCSSGGHAISVEGGDGVGGLVGWNSGTLTDSYSVGRVTATAARYSGGLVGWNEGNLGNCHSNSSVTGQDIVGGLVAANAGNVSNCYATGKVLGERIVGGLSGLNAGSLSNTYSTGSVLGHVHVGGLVGSNEGTVSNSYSIGVVLGDSESGGLIGSNWTGTVDNSFWNTESTGMTESAGGTGKTTDEMTGIATFTETATEGLDHPWDIAAVAHGDTDDTSTWNIVDGQTYPFFYWGQPVEIGRIWNWGDLNTIRYNLDGHYILMSNLDDTTVGYEELAGPTASQGEGWQPIGTDDAPFMGAFSGRGYEIGQLVVDRPDEDGVGLFGVLGRTGVVCCVRIADADVTGRYAVGSVVGQNIGGTVTGLCSSGIVTGNYSVGGLVGRNNAGSVTNSSSTGSITGTRDIGGLVGLQSHGGIVRNACSSGYVSGDERAGGLVGQSHSGIVRNSCSSASVTGTEYIGGLVGFSYESTVSESYATGTVGGSLRVGGLVGRNQWGTVSNSYATGSVTGGSYAGGLVGQGWGGSVSDCYARGTVVGSSYVGGLVGGRTAGGVVSSLWDKEASGVESSAGGSGMTTAEMKDIGTFHTSGWDICAVAFGVANSACTWNIIDGAIYPFLSWEEPMTVIADWRDLDAVRYDLGGSYILISDLDVDTEGYTDLAGPTANDGKGWDPIGGEDHPFTGSFYGLGCDIHDLCVDRPDEDYVGLFGYLGSNSVVGDIGLIHTDVTGGNHLGGLAGRNDGTVKNSHSSGKATGSEDAGGLVGYNCGTVARSYSTSIVTGAEYVGGLVGANRDGTVSNSYSSGGVIGGSGVGGLVGQNSGIVTHSSSTCDVTGSSRVGGLVGENPRGSVNDSYSTGAVSGEQAVGGLVGDNPHGYVSDSNSGGTVTGEESVGGLIGGHYSGTVHNSHYNYDEVLINGEIIITVGALSDEDFGEWLANDKFLDIGERLPQEQGYYVIGNVTDLKQLLAFGQDGSLRFRLDDHLDLGSEPGFYIPYMAGEFRGYGHMISNLSLDLDCVSQVGLFGYLAPSGTVTELAVKHVSITGDVGVGGVVGVNWGGTISNSYTTGIAMGSSGIGGLVGVNWEGTVSDSHSRTDVAGDHDVGGLVGHNRGDVRNSYSAGGVTGHSSAGGLVGHDDGTVGNSFWDMDTSIMEGSYGGTGKTTVEMMDIATFTDTATEGLDEPWDMTAVAPGETNPAYTWNIVHGESHPFLSRRTPSPEVRDWHDLHSIRDNLGRDFVLLNDLDSATAGYAELAGPTANHGKGWQPIGDSGAEQFTGTLDGQGYEIRDLLIDLGEAGHGGLFHRVGEGGVIENLGVVNATVTAGMAGGLVVWNSGTINECHFAGNLTGEWGAGGLVGGSWGTVTNSHSTGSVNAMGVELGVGGLVGSNGGTVSNSYSSCSVTGEVYLGGLVGWNMGGTVSSCHATGMVTAEWNAGGLVGSNSGTVSDSYSSGDISGQNNVGGLVGGNSGIVKNSYATGTVTRSSETWDGFGGFVGQNWRGKIINCYSTARVHYQDPYDDPTDKGFAGIVDTGGEYEMTGNFWDTETSGQATTAGDAAGKTTAEMMDIATFTDIATEGLDEPWDIVAVAPGVTFPAHTWNIVEGQTYPFHGWELDRGAPAVASKTETVTDDTLDAKAEADTEVLVTGSATVTVAQFSDNPGDDHLAGFASLGKYIDVYVPDTDDVDEVEIRLYYTADDLAAAALSQVSLRLLWWDGAQWVECSETGVNPADSNGYIGYIWARITEFSSPGLAQLTGTPFAGAGDIVDQGIIEGQTKEVNCIILPGVTVTLYQNGTEMASTVSGLDGYYTLAVPGQGDYTVVAGKAGFRDEQQSVPVDDLTTYTVHFVGSHGLIPNAPNMSYVLACINLWQFGEPQCKLTMSTVLAVINAWQFPVSDN